MSFLIDTSKLSSWEDIKADRNGVYSSVLRCAVWTVACEVNQNDTSFEIITNKKETLADDNQYHLTMNSKRNKASPTLVRSIFLLTSKSGKIVNDACLLQYHISSEEDTVNIEVQPHETEKNASHAPFTQQQRAPYRNSTRD